VSLFSTKEVHLEMVVTLVVRVCMCVFLLVTVSLLLSVRNICCTYGVVICLERGADLHMAQLMPMPLASVKSRLVFTFLVPAHPGSPGKGKGAVRVCVCACVYFSGSSEI